MKLFVYKDGGLLARLWAKNRPATKKCRMSCDVNGILPVRPWNWFVGAHKCPRGPICGLTLYPVIRESTTVNEEEFRVTAKEYGIDILLTRHDCACFKDLCILEHHLD
jgi:hypothetical protein